MIPMHVQQGGQHLVRHVRDGLFGERHLRVQQIGETARIHVLHHDLAVMPLCGTDPELIVEVVRFFHVHDLRTLGANLEGDLLVEDQEVAVVLHHLHSVLVAALGDGVAGK